jgi:hypothetical protein
MQGKIEAGDSSRLAAVTVWRAYLRRGRYAEQIERWVNQFPREQCQMLAMDDLAGGSIVDYDGRVRQWLGGGA